MNRPYGRIYYATEYALAKEDRQIKRKEITVAGKTQYIERVEPKDDAEYSPGYRAVIWGVDGKALYSNEVPKLDLDTTPAEAFVRLYDEAVKLAPKVGPIDLYAHGAGTTITQTVGA